MHEEMMSGDSSEAPSRTPVEVHPRRPAFFEDSDATRETARKRGVGSSPVTEDDEQFEEPEPAELPIDGVLDLHTFHPREVPDLVPTYLDECRDQGVLEVRIIHGKGIGNLRRTVHAALERREDVAEYGLAPAHRGGWGATLVTLKPKG